MELRILNREFIDVDVLDTFDSMIWTDRYSQYGDFEIYTPANEVTLNLLHKDFYIWYRDSEHVMIIEEREISTDVEEGNFITITGRSLESILLRRIVWKQTILSGNLQNGIERLLNENVINPEIPERRISNFIFEASTDPAITALTIEAQFTGDYIYDAIKKLCDSKQIGFKVILRDGMFVFSLYSGVDRSYSQLVNPHIVFSPNLDNLFNSNYFESKKALKTVTLVAGEGEGVDRKTAVIAVSNDGGLDRRELFTEARDISSDTNDGTLTPEEYTAQLQQRGLEKLSENIFITSFEGQADTTQLYRYGEDFFMGDIVQTRNEYGLESKSRVVEVVHSQNIRDGISIYPTFKIVE